MLVAAAVCPCPPLLVPQVAAGAARELDTLRDACAVAIDGLSAARPDRLLVVGPADQDGRGMYDQGATGSFARFGVDLDVTLGQPVQVAAGDRSLPPSLAVGAWLLQHNRWAGAPCQGLGVGEPFAPGECHRVGRDLAAAPGRLALLVMGDGSACRTEKAPGYLDERAAPFDAGVASALAGADAAALAALDEKVAAELRAAGRAPWQVLAGAASGADVTGRLLYDGAPYGVGYLVSLWTVG